MGRVVVFVCAVQCCIMVLGSRIPPWMDKKRFVTPAASPEPETGDGKHEGRDACGNGAEASACLADVEAMCLREDLVEAGLEGKQDGIE